MVILAMKRTASLLMAALLVVSLVGMAGVVAAQDDAAAEAEIDVEPGERLNGVLYVVDAEIEGEIAERGFGISVAEAATNESEAEIVANRLDDVEERVADLEERQDALNASLDDGEMSEGQHAAEMAQLQTERATAERLANQSAAVAADLPEEVLAEQGINVSAIDELRDRADELGGEDVAAIAQEIAGPSVGEELPDTAEDRIPDDVGPVEDRDSDAADDEQADDTTNDDGDHEDDATDNGADN